MALVAAAILFKEPLQSWIHYRATLANDAPAPEVVAEFIDEAKDPGSALLDLWESGKMVHRQGAIRGFSRKVARSDPLSPELERLLFEATLDPDTSVREAALGILAHREHPATLALAAAQLRDPDQEVRRLGLQHLKQAKPAVGIPVVAAMLDDPDIGVLGASLSLLERWTGESFGSNMADTVQAVDEKTGLLEFREAGAAKTRAAAEKARAWWKEHQQEFAAVNLPVPAAASEEQRPLRAPDFRLHDLEGGEVRLSDYRGRVVLINFWTTWCTACVGEMPALAALQRRHSDDLTILGVSLDFAPDSHGHLGGHAAVEEQGQGDDHHDDHESTAAAIRRIRQKVARTAKARGIHYPILLDEENDVGSQYNGGELPTTVIVDAQGYVRRRFVGTRSVAVFEGMIAAASKPASLRARP